MTDTFVHLGLHSEYSLADSVVRIKPLMEAVREKNMPAVALTDQCNVFAMVRFYRAALAAGIFHRREVPIAEVKARLRADGIPVRA